MKIPNVDFSVLPAELAGQWVVLRVGAKQELLGRGVSPKLAIEASGADPEAPDVVLTEVPRVPAVARSVRTEL